MLRHQTIAFALFLSAGCELAGAPPAPPAKPVAPTPTAATEPEKPAPTPAAPGVSSTATSAAEPALLDAARVRDMDFRPTMRGGPSWGKERPRFKMQPPPATPAAAPAPAPAPKADAP